MSIKQLNPYLIFNGEADQAMKLYESALDAKVDSAMRYGDIPSNQPAPENKNRVIHAVLKIGTGTLMMSDAPADKPVTVGGNNYVSLDFDDTADMQRKFDALASGGEVTMSVQDTFWGAKFGMLSDAFGVRWMFNCDQKR